MYIAYLTAKTSSAATVECQKSNSFHALKMCLTLFCCRTTDAHNFRPIECLQAITVINRVQSRAFLRKSMQCWHHSHFSHNQNPVNLLGFCLPSLPPIIFANIWQLNCKQITKLSSIKCSKRPTMSGDLILLCVERRQ